MEPFTILTINPGSTSTKIAVFKNETLTMEKTLRHSNEELSQYTTVADQFEFRKNLIINALKADNFNLATLNAIVGRGGLLHPIKSGVYEVNEAMKADLRHSPLGEHASNLGGLIAEDMAKNIGANVRAFIADPVVVDEMQEVARMTGLKLFERKSIFHALNQKAVARAYAKEHGTQYENLNLIIAHMGGGISIGAHQKGLVIDVNNALDGEGPFTPERTGTLPVGPLVNLCFSGKYTKEEIKEMIKGQGGMMNHLGTNDTRVAREAIAEGDQDAKKFLDAMCYNIAKYIGSMAVVLDGNVDAIILTGGIAYGTEQMKQIEEKVKFIAPVSLFPGEDEMLALALNGLRVLRGETQPAIYSSK